MHHQISIHEDSLIFLAEVLLLQHVSIDGALSASTTLVRGVTLFDLKTSNTLVLRELFREPLQKRSFRKKLMSHFETHPVLCLRILGDALLEELLTWDAKEEHT